VKELEEAFDFCKKYLREAVKCLEEGDIVQACEKLYKVAEETVKALAKSHELDEHKVASERGRWVVSLLEGAVRSLSRIYGYEVEEAWSVAYNRLHIDCFHEGKLRSDDVKDCIPRVEYLVSVLGERLKEVSSERLSISN